MLKPFNNFLCLLFLIAKTIAIVVTINKTINNGIKIPINVFYYLLSDSVTHTS